MTFARIHKTNTYGTITMKRIVFVVCVFSSFTVLSWCGNTVDDILVATWTVSAYTTSYLISPLSSSPLTIYGTVVAGSIKTISTNKGGILEYLDCQPGKIVTRDTIIGKIQANTEDATYQNWQIQIKGLEDQLSNLTKIYSLTQDTLALQKNILYDQYQNNVTLLDNLEQSQSYTDSSLGYQEKLLAQQYLTLKESKSTDLDKMKTSIANAYKQYLILVKDALKKVNDVFTNNNYSVSDTDPNLKQDVLSEYSRRKNNVSDTMSSDQFSQYLLDMSELMSLAARAVNASTPSVNLPQSSSMWWVSIDGLYATFTTLATTFVWSKSAFDTLASSYDSVKNTYNGQLKSADLNADNFSQNTSKSTALQLENQKAGLQLTQKTLQTQLNSSDNNTAIQLISLKNQLITLKQNIVVLSNSFDGEVLYAGVDGIIKTKMLGEDNKVNPNTPLCQIAPNDELNMSIQVFSYQKLTLGTRVALSTQQWQFLATWVILYEYPYRDPATQNYIYEIPVVRAAVKENERVIVSLEQAINTKEIWIPLSYVSPRLEWYLVRVKTVRDNIKDVYVELWPINAWYVQVLSWLGLWNRIVQ